MLKITKDFRKYRSKMKSQPSKFKCWTKNHPLNRRHVATARNPVALSSTASALQLERCALAIATVSIVTMMISTGMREIQSLRASQTEILRPSKPRLKKLISQIRLFVTNVAATAINQTVRRSTVNASKTESSAQSFVSALSVRMNWERRQGMD